MQIFDLSKQAKEGCSFEPIKMPEVEPDELNRVLDAAEQSLFKYKKMAEFLEKADSLSSGIYAGTWLYDFMTEECHVPNYEDSAIDITSELLKHVRIQINRFRRFCEELECEIEDAEEQRCIDAKYGTDKEQEVSLFYSTR